MSMLTDKQAYTAMFYFLEKYWEINNSMEIRSLLSDMSLLSDGSTADPAMVSEWQKAVQYVLNGGQAGQQVLT
jgi:hypothetical protein